MSLSLVSPAEDKAQSQIAEATKLAFLNVRLEGRLLGKAQERVNLASKIVAAEDFQQKIQSRNLWFQEHAHEAGIEVDDDLVERTSDLPMREQLQLMEAEKAKIKLAQLLSEPLKTSKYGKFLCANTGIFPTAP